VSAVTGERLAQYRLMHLIRRFEDRAAELFQQGVIFGTAHSCVGQEAIAVGAAGVMRDTDYLVGHHRSHGHLIAAGADLRRMMAEMFGKRTGYCKGLGGSMHIADLSLDILGCNGIVGAGIPQACGAALTAKLHDTGQVAVAYFGDGAAGQGAVHEGMNLAVTWKLPVVFICENNQFALSADWRTQLCAVPTITPAWKSSAARSSTRRIRCISRYCARRSLVTVLTSRAR
jgi:2-oxoisovalerate dehydrogenase E1 component